MPAEILVEISTVLRGGGCNFCRRKLQIHTPILRIKGEALKVRMCPHCAGAVAGKFKEISK